MSNTTENNTIDGILVQYGSNALDPKIIKEEDFKLIPALRVQLGAEKWLGLPYNTRLTIMNTFATNLLSN